MWKLANLSAEEERGQSTRGNIRSKYLVRAARHSSVNFKRGSSGFCGSCESLLGSEINGVTAALLSVKTTLLPNYLATRNLVTPLVILVHQLRINN